MNRLENIAAFVERREEKALQAEQTKNDNIKKYKEEIRALKPRIEELVKIGNACLQANIPLTGQSFGCHEGYDTHQFMSNSWSHLLGFINHNKGPIISMGIIGGGACNFNLITDGDLINVSGDEEFVLKRFLDNFDTFETEFYNYVDKITSK